MDSWSATIKSYPDLSLVVMRRRLEGPYRLWLVGRHLDREGTGRVLIKRLRAFVVQHHICTRRTLFRELTRPSLFWRKHRAWIYLVGVLKVSDHLDVRLRSQPVMLPIASFTSMRELRSAFVGSYLSGKPRTIAIETLAALTGRTRRTIIRYLQSSHVTKTRNAMSSVRRPQRHLDRGLADQGYFHTRFHGTYRLVKRMPNTYETDLETAPRGITRKQTETSSLSTEKAPPPAEDPESSLGGGASSDPRGAPRRLYYSRQKPANRALQSLSPHETVYTLSSGHVDALGFQLWRGWTILESGGPIVSR